MCLSNRKGFNQNNLVNYSLPKLHTGKNWYIDFQCYDPVEQRMRRKKYMLDSIERIKERRARASELIAVITAKLRTGWNPWADASNSRQYTLFQDVADYYLKYLDKSVSAGVFRLKTKHDYCCKLRILLDYNSKRAYPVVYVYQFDQSFLSDFLDYVLLDRDSTAITRNTYRLWLSGFCSFLVEKRLLEANPVANIRVLKESEKFRKAITQTDLRLLKSYLSKTNKYFLLACQFEYYTFIRPGELSNIKIGDISIKDQRVFVSAAISKNRRDGAVALNDTLIKLMIELDDFSHPSDSYLFGKDFRPSPVKASSEVFRLAFVKLRGKLKFPKEYQFYSLKDSGIRDLANSEGIVVARDQARHTDVSTTNRYLVGDSLTVHESSKHFVGDL